MFLSLVTAICREESLDEETRKWWDGAQVLKSYLRLDLAKQLLSNVVQGDNKLLKDFAEGLAKFLKSMSSNVERTIVSADLCHRVLNFGYDAVGKRLLVIDSGIDVRSTTYLDMKLGQARTSRILARLQLSSEDILALRQRRIEQKEQRRKANG